jgi:hypothetical protein
MKKKAILECNECGKRIHTSIWTRITAGKDRKIDEKIFNDEINYFECDRCDNEGFACYPIKITDKESGETAIIIPEDSVGFAVVEVKGKAPSRVFYDFDDLKWHIYFWQDGYNAVFDPPPEERDLKEGQEKGIITEKEAYILRGTDWDSFFDNLDEENKKLNWTDEQIEICDLYSKLMSELEQSRKVVKLKR